MKSKEKQIRELEKRKDIYLRRRKDVYYWGLIIALLLIFLMTIVIILKDDKIQDLEQELSEYQNKDIVKWKCPVLLEEGTYIFENGILISPSAKIGRCEIIDKIPIWTFKMKCSLPYDVKGSDVLLYSKYFNFEKNFTNYEDYLTMKMIINNDENCEVIE